MRYFKTASNSFPEWRTNGADIEFRLLGCDEWDESTFTLADLQSDPSIVETDETGQPLDLRENLSDR